MRIMGFSDNQQKILQILLREKNGMAIDQFSKLLGISRTATHQHMVVLERDDYVKNTPQFKQKVGLEQLLF